MICSAYVISCGMRIAQGSATVAIVTTAGSSRRPWPSSGIRRSQLALIAMAISAGSIIASHVNDGGFWIVSRYFNMTRGRRRCKSWTVLETVLSVSGFGVSALLMAVV